MAGRSSHNCVGDSCESRIPLYPLRYSVHFRKEGDKANTAYETSGLPLESGFPVLNKAQYGLRYVGSGFIYLIDETEGDFFVWKVDAEAGKFIELLAKGRTLDNALDSYKEGNSVFNLWARPKSQVHLLLTDTLLTEAKMRDLRANKDGVRDKLATSIDLSNWQASAPARDTFPVERIGDVLEEFSDRDLSFSPWPFQSTFKSPDALLKNMRLSSLDKQLAVVLHDQIALVQDFGGLFQVTRQRLAEYTLGQEENSGGQGAQRFRKKIIADIIDKIYLAAYAQEKDIDPKDGAQVDKSLERDIYRRNRFGRANERRAAARNPEAVKKKDPNTAAIENRADALSAAAGRYAKHVREKERVAFLKDYATELDKHHGAVLDIKNDRHTWLERYPQTGAKTDFGSTFLRYDTNNELSGTTHAVAFALCTEGMIWGTAQTPKGKEDRERALYGKWCSQPADVSPIIKNMGLDKGFFETAAKSFSETAAENKADVLTDIGGRSLHTAARFYALHSLTQQLGVHALTRRENWVVHNSGRGSQRDWKGAVRNNMDAQIHRLAGTGTVEDARRIREIIERSTGGRVIAQELTLVQHDRLLMDAADIGGPIVVEGSIAQPVAGQAPRPHGNDVVMIFDWERVGPVARRVNPFLMATDGVIAGGALIFSYLNLTNAIRNLRLQRDVGGYATRANLAAAVMGIGSALNSLVVSAQAVINRIFHRVMFAHRVIERLASVGTLRFFGYGGAFFDALTNGLKAFGQYEQGNIEASSFYALAGLGLGLGGAALTTSAAGLLAASGQGLSVATGMLTITLGFPVWGWFVAGVILLGLGVWALNKAEKEVFTPIDYWLNDGSFGQRQIMGRSTLVTYTDLSEETEALRALGETS